MTLKFRNTLLWLTTGIHDLRNTVLITKSIPIFQRQGQLIDLIHILNIFKLKSKIIYSRIQAVNFIIPRETFLF